MFLLNSQMHRAKNTKHTRNITKIDIHILLYCSWDKEKMSKKILKNTNPVVDDSDDDEHEPVEVSSRQSKQAAAEEL